MKLITKLSYGVGQLSDGVKQASFSTFLFFYYNQVVGLSGSLAGMAALSALMVDAITDPMVGQLSDRFSSRWGRRHPFMLAGAIPFGVAIVALFSPPDGLSQMALFGWMLGGAISVRLMLTFFFVPHLSLGAELATDYHGRTSLIGYRVFFTYAGIFAFSPQVLYFAGLLESMSITAKCAFVFTVNSISKVFFIAYIILLDSTFSDVIDEHELNTSKREEGLFFAAGSFATKASYGLGSFFAGIGLDFIHFPQSASPETVPADAVLSLAILSGPVMFVLFSATVIISSRYPLTAARHSDIMHAIKARGGSRQPVA